jgi:oligopeptide/dipeptide ABC transporter ATP-binding protein
LAPDPVRPDDEAITVLDIGNLEVEYTHGGVTTPAVRQVSLQISRGTALALIGESGSGKSSLALAVMRLIRPPVGRITGGDITLDKTSITGARRAELRSILRHRIGFIPQDPTTSLDPLFTIGAQVAEVMPPMRRAARNREIGTLLESLGVAEATTRLRSYPHEFSGGMRQRVAMAIALAKGPDLLIADEPTTALDVTTQISILRLLDRLRLDRHLTTLFITHDLRVARLLCQEVAVMYAGLIVESGPMTQVLGKPSHPYTKALLDLSAAGRTPGARLPTIPGQPPGLQEHLRGCPFAPRCSRALDTCRTAIPGEETRADGVRYRCWNPVTR